MFSSLNPNFHISQCKNNVCRLLRNSITYQTKKHGGNAACRTCCSLMSNLWMWAVHSAFILSLLHVGMLIPWLEILLHFTLAPFTWAKHKIVHLVFGLPAIFQYFKMQFSNMHNNAGWKCSWNIITEQHVASLLTNKCQLIWHIRSNIACFIALLWSGSSLLR